MPYETRRGRLSLAPEAGERFTRDTWNQADFLAPDFRLPYPDAFFDFAYCGQTLEDLSDPFPLLREMARVARAGRIVSPSRLTEQTRGVRDRATSLPGHPHHHWIIDTTNDCLDFFPKAPSVASSTALIPLYAYERLVHSGQAHPNIDHIWTAQLHWRVHAGDTAACRATTYAQSLAIPVSEKAIDSLLRAVRRLRDFATRRPPSPGATWWQGMIELSRPYNRLHQPPSS